jgi:hypothetical protein
MHTIGVVQCKKSWVFVKRAIAVDFFIAESINFLPYFLPLSCDVVFC